MAAKLRPSEFPVSYGGWRAVWMVYWDKYAERIAKHVVSFPVKCDGGKWLEK
jgi:hypothetical protein